MIDPGQAMIDNLAKNTGRPLEEWFAVLDGTGLVKHTELMNHLKGEHGVSHGFANGIVLRYRERGSTPSSNDLSSSSKPARRRRSVRSMTP